MGALIIIRIVSRCGSRAGGVKPGVTVGESDDFGFNATKDKVHVNDGTATILHLLGFDHTKLTYRFRGATSGRPTCTERWWRSC
jgi:hypothetical protein